MVHSSSSRDLLSSSPGGVVRSSASVASQPRLHLGSFFLPLLLFVHIRYITHELGPYGSDRLNGSVHYFPLLNGSVHYFPPQWWFSFSSRLRLKQSAAHTSLYAPLRRSKFGTETCEKSPFSHFELLLKAQGAFLRENVQLLTAAGTLAPSGWVPVSGMGNSREKMREQSESHSARMRLFKK